MRNLITGLKEAVKNWWISLVIGILLLIVGIWSLFTPFETFAVLTVLFVVAFFIEGILEIIFAISNRKIQSGWGWDLALGIIDVILAIYLIINMAIAPLVLSMVIAIWVLIRSIWEIAISIDLKRVPGSGWGWLLTLGILGIILAAFMLFRPVFTAALSAYFIGFALILYGIFRIYLAFRLRRLHKDIKSIEK